MSYSNKTARQLIRKVMEGEDPQDLAAQLDKETDQEAPPMEQEGDAPCDPETDECPPEMEGCKTEQDDEEPQDDFEDDDDLELGEEDDFPADDEEPEADDQAPMPEARRRK